MNKCCTVEWNSHEGEPELIGVYKDYQHALDHCVFAIEEAKRTEEDYSPDHTFNIIVDTVEGSTWVELHRFTRFDAEDERSQLIEWYKITEREFEDA